MSSMAAAALGYTLLISLRRRDDEKERERLRYVCWCQQLLEEKIQMVLENLCCAPRKGARCAKGDGYGRHAGQSSVQIYRFPDYGMQRSIYRLKKYVQETVEGNIAPSETSRPKHRRSLGKRYQGLCRPLQAERRNGTVRGMWRELEGRGSQDIIC
jgi:hypothetical protein